MKNLEMKYTNENLEGIITEFGTYEKLLLKNGITSSVIRYLNDCKIVLKQETFEKLGRKTFPQKPTNTEIRELTVRQYLCYITSTGYFGDRVSRGYTIAGYIPTRLTCKRPDNEVRIVRSFSIERGDM